MWHATLTKAIAWMSGYMLADGPTCQKEVFGHLQVQGSQLAHANYVELQTEIDAVLPAQASLLRCLRLTPEPEASKPIT